MIRAHPRITSLLGRPHRHVAPHELSSQLLFRMWRQDRTPALACLDQPEVLRQVWPKFREDAVAATHLGYARSCLRWNVARARVSARTTAAGYSTDCHHVRAGSSSSSRDSRTALHMWSADEERNTVFATRAWTSALLAAQRSCGNAPCREVDD